MKRVIFGYKTNIGMLHRVPALVKLILLLPLSIFCMSLPVQWLCAGIGAAVVFAFICRFTVREQMTDLKPVVFYAVLMYSLSIFSNIWINWQDLSFFIFLPKPDYLQLVFRLILIIQLSAFIFRTTTSLEIRDALCRINKSLGETISLFLSFIPQIFENWSIINKAWKARGGKNNIKKIKTLLFVLISLSLEKASLKAKAIEARKYS